MPKAATSAALKIDLARARAHWHSRQGLAEPFPGSIGEAIAATGWLRTLGGADVYLAMRARRPGMKRSELDHAQESSQVQVSPAARGCIYLVPALHVPLALRIAEDQHRKKIDRELEKAGSSLKEVTERAEAVLATLQAKGALTTDALRKAAPAEALRSLGEQGKKVGVSSTLGPSLRELEFAGKIERTLEGGRLDTERYLWAPAKKKAHAQAKVPGTAEGRNALLAELFFGWVGPATMKDFAEWAGLAVRAAKTAVEKAPLAPVAVEGYAADALALESDLSRLKEPYKPSKAVRLLSSEDNFLILHGGPRYVTDEKHHGQKLEAWGTIKPMPIGEAKHITSRMIVVGDCLAGFWELDPDAGKVVTKTFDPLPSAQAKELAALAADVAAFLEDEMGHAKSFSLDAEEEIRKRAKAIKAM
jgi:hypothetical protein